jgi:hypothetical protein
LRPHRPGLGKKKRLSQETETVFPSLSFFSLPDQITTRKPISTEQSRQVQLLRGRFKAPDIAAKNLNNFILTRFDVAGTSISANPVMLACEILWVPSSL